jgi:amino acid adenylation domain-containing protein
LKDSISVVNELGGGEIPFPRERTVVELFQEQVRTQPEKLAVKAAGQTISYAELDLKSSLVAAELQRCGLALEEPVAILIAASCEYVIAMLGVLKAGGSYLPLDPSSPAKRLESLLQASGSHFVLADSNGNQPAKEWLGTRLEVTAILGRTSVAPQKFQVASPSPRRRAYIVYTSGSTGEPKGVEIEHHSLTNLVWAYRQKFNLSTRDRSTMFANVAFDASVADTWPTLCTGGSLIVPPRELVQHPDGLIAWLENEAITWTFVPTGLAEILFTRSWPEQLSLRFLVTGGDRLQIRPPQNLPFTILNAYGPTENTVISTWSVLDPLGSSSQLPAVGRPITNVTAYVLDEQQHPVADGVAGELYLGGEQIARGYLGRPDLTAERFVPDPFRGKPIARMYRTGDWVRWLPDGQLDFLGRRDDQVQIRGSRIELGEIEATLLAHPFVRSACCLPQSDAGQATGIVAHIVPANAGDDLSEALRIHLGERLPSYMVPARFIFHEHFPLTSYGKVDRTALANSVPKKIPPPPLEAIGDGLEIALSRLWHSLLPAAGSSPKDAGFTTIGGDSLVLVKLMLGVEEITNQRLEASTFLVEPTFPGLCQAVKRRMSQTEFQPVLTLRKHGTRPPLFLLYNYEGDIDVYFHLAVALGNDQPVFGLRSPALENLAKLPSSLEAAAAEIVGWIRKIQPHGRPALVGYSWAGLLAFETARQLAAQAKISGFTALIGADAPMRPTTISNRLTHFIRNFPPWLWHLIADQENRWRRIADWQKMARSTKQNLTDERVTLPDEVLSPLARHMVVLMEKYSPPPTAEVVVDLFRERGSYQSRPHPLRAWQTSHRPDGGWNNWTHKPVQVHWLDGDHWTILKPPAVFALAQSLRQAMDRHFSVNQ